MYQVDATKEALIAAVVSLATQADSPVLMIEEPRGPILQPNERYPLYLSDEGNDGPRHLVTRVGADELNLVESFFRGDEIIEFERLTEADVKELAAANPDALSMNFDLQDTHVEKELNDRLTDLMWFCNRNGIPMVTFTCLRIDDESERIVESAMHIQASKCLRRLRRANNYPDMGLEHFIAALND